jgi:small-conductance mechanosensitive channel
MLDLLKKFEKGVTVTLVVLMALVVLLATVADSLVVQWLASVFALEAAGLSPLALASRGTLNALAGGLLFALVDRQRERSAR